MKWRAQNIMKQPFKKVHNFNRDNRDMQTVSFQVSVYAKCMVENSTGRLSEESWAIGICVSKCTFPTNFPKRVFYKKYIIIKKNYFSWIRYKLQIHFLVI